MKPLSILLPFLLVAATPAQIAYIKRNHIYTLASPHSKPVRICSIKWNKHMGTLKWTKEDQLLISGQFNGQESIWLLTPTSHSKPRRLTTGQYPSPSPDGKDLVFEREWPTRNPKATRTLTFSISRQKGRG